MGLGRLIFEETTVSLKRYPDTKPEFPPGVAKACPEGEPYLHTHCYALNPSLPYTNQISMTQEFSQVLA